MKGSTPTWLGVDQDTAELPPLVSGTGAPARRVTSVPLCSRPCALLP